MVSQFLSVPDLSQTAALSRQLEGLLVGEVLLGCGVLGRWLWLCRIWVELVQMPDGVFCPCGNGVGVEI